MSKNTPTSKDVKRELTKLLKDFESYKEQAPSEGKGSSYPKELVEFIREAMKTILDFIYEYRYPILIILIIGFILFFIFAFRKKNPYTNFGGTLHPVQGGNYFDKIDELSFQELYNKAVEQSQLKNYNQAIVYLHLATISFLLDKLVIDRDIEYTNKDIIKLLTEKTGPIESFSKIASCAEISGFSDIVINGEEYHVINKLFERDFLKVK